MSDPGGNQIRDKDLLDYAAWLAEKATELHERETLFMSSDQPRQQVNCHAGQTRSPAAALGWLVMYHGLQEDHMAWAERELYAHNLRVFKECEDAGQPLPARVVFKAVDNIPNGGRLLTVFKSQAFRDLVASVNVSKP